AYTTTRQLLTTYKKELERAKEHSALNEYCKDNGIPVESVGNYWHKGKHFSVHVKQNENDIEELARSVIAELDEYVVQYPHIRRKPVKEPHLLVIDPADIHIGKLASSFETGEDYDSQIAVKRVKEGIQGILNKSKGFNIDKILFVAGNDVL
ncbi:MAG: hypothetical protein GWO07_14095, partial [Candidatus Dadabacteria bacterium]|nr:hypothetical protein [Candidatus Dadabacteria bacterium]NIU87662.1 hypothetical protein [Nitrosopumilaceae archaeon]NIX16711.1 hypothetical protein [Candidatus Dadabacteria bacterium]